MTTVARNLNQAGVDVLVPGVVSDLLTSKVLVMEYIDGFKVFATYLFIPLYPRTLLILQS